MVVVNLYAGPGAGKSTIAAKVFCELKEDGENVELVTEYAKDVIWDDNTSLLKDSLYIFAQQLHRVERLRGKVDICIVDSPILLALFYGETVTPALKEVALERYANFINLNYLIHRKYKHCEAGRVHDEITSIGLDSAIIEFMRDNELQYTDIIEHKLAPAIIKQDIQRELRGLWK